VRNKNDAFKDDDTCKSRLYVAACNVLIAIRDEIDIDANDTNCVGTNDVFALIVLGKNQFRTSVKQKALPINVDWNEQCQM